MAWPLHSASAQRVGTTRDAAATTMGWVTVTAHATIHTKGDWVELIAATTGPGRLVAIAVYGTAVSGTNTSMLLDIGVGAAASEVVLIPDLGVGYTRADTAPVSPRHWSFPVYVPSGARLSARCQGVITVDTVLVAVDVYGGDNFNNPGVFQQVTAYGASSAASRGTSVNNGAVGAHVKGAWVQITASTADDIRMLAVATQGNTSTSVLGRTHLFDIAVGAAASEVAVVSDLFLLDTSAEVHPDVEPGNVIPRLIDIPSGTRLSVRRQCSATSDTTFDIILYGLR